MRCLGLTACLATVLLGAAAPAAAQAAESLPPAPAPAADDALSEALAEGELTEAEYALERARSVFELNGVRREFGDVARPSPRDTTLILRDLAVRLRLLTGDDRAAAKQLLARPPQGSGKFLPGNGWHHGVPKAKACGTNVCVHWVDAASDPDAPPPEDTHPPIDVPDWVELTLQTWEDVWAAEIDTLGYRAPLSDFSSAHNGGDGTLDVYLEDLGSSGVFGYCTSDDPLAAHTYAVSAFCVVDNDFSEFGSQHTPAQFLEVTSAHEFHHASQFAYDWLEDYWFMEGTATNMEETVYPDIDDNVSFLRFWSPLNRPASPLDRAAGDSEYGSWIFWRFLQEKVGGDPSILREIWERADAAGPGAPDDYSLLAVRHELSQRGLPFRDAFAQFGTTNRLLDYADAPAAGYPKPPLTKTYAIGKERPVLNWREWKINHLATRFVAFKPGHRVPAGSTLRVKVRLPKTGSRATVIVVNADGSIVTRQFVQHENGKGKAGTRFGPGAVKRVEVVLSNAGTRFRSCGRFSGPPSYSCAGRPLDDHRVFEVKAKLVVR